MISIRLRDSSYLFIHTISIWYLLYMRHIVKPPGHKNIGWSLHFWSCKSNVPQNTVYFLKECTESKHMLKSWQKIFLYELAICYILACHFLFLPFNYSSSSLEEHILLCHTDWFRAGAHDADWASESWP